MAEDSITAESSATPPVSDDASTKESTVGFVGRAWRRLTESSHERLLRESAADHLRRHPGERVLDIESCVPGEEVTMAGSVTSVGNLSEEHPALEIELSDTTGRIFVVWLGRRRIPGIHVGRRMVIHGRLNCVSEHPTVFNPRYELLPG
ncbi:MAG TPA: DNA-binding protein [Actinobacteria bacterium]|nr:DNA-binding protein [Actinomycetota bacterium]